MDEVSFVKKYLAFILVIGAFILISPFKVSAAALEEWGEKLDLSDSVSSSVIKLDDGIVVMKYEGGASDNSTLTKYDFNGKEVWSIKNDYGYEIASLGDGFIVFTECDDSVITKISSDGKVVWSKHISPIGLDERSFVLDFDSGFLLYDEEGIHKFDNSGNLLKSINMTSIAWDIAKTHSLPGFGVNVPDLDGGPDTGTISLSKDEKHFLFFGEISLEKQSMIGGVDPYSAQVVAQISLDLDYESSTVNDLISSGQNVFTNGQSVFTKFLETENNYIYYGGDTTLVFDKEVKLNKSLNIALLNAQYIDGYVYGYVFKEAENSKEYHTYIVKYDENLKKIDEYQLPVDFSIRGLTSTLDLISGWTSLPYFKNRGFFYEDSNGVHFVHLNSSIEKVSSGVLGNYANSLNSNYGIFQYRFTDDDFNNIADKNDGIIDNIFENPETSSTIAVVIAFVIVILIGGLGFYLGYKKKVKAK